MNHRILMVSTFALTLALFQNCAKEHFSSTLTAGMVDTNGNPTTSSVNPDIPAGVPETSPTPTPTPTPTNSSKSGSGDQLCIAVNQGNSGVNNKVGADLSVELLQSQNGIPNAVCVSANACLVLINNYLNLTGGVFGGPVGSAPQSPLQYTKQKITAVCAHNPNVVHLTDDEVQTYIDNLEH